MGFLTFIRKTDGFWSIFDRVPLKIFTEKSSVAAKYYFPSEISYFCRARVTILSDNREPEKNPVILPLNTYKSICSTSKH